MDEMHKHYQILGLKPGASEKEIVEAYKVLVKVWQPAQFSDDPNVQKIATEKIREIDETFKQLLIGVAAIAEKEQPPASEEKPYGTPTPSQQEPLYEPSSKPLPRDDLKRSTEQAVVSPLGNEKDSSVEKPISTSAFWKEISFIKLLLFIMLLPAAVILLDGFLGFTFYDLSRKLAGSEFGIIVYIFYFSLGIWIADYIYKLRELTLIIALSFIVLFFYRFLIAISLYYEFIGQAMINTLKEGVIVYASLSLFSFLFRYFEPRFDYAEICNIIEFTDPITKKKYNRGTCTKCGSITIVAKERAISFLGKSTEYFCDNCNRFLRGNPLNNIFLGLTESASSLIFMLGIASSQQGKASSYSSIFLLLFFVGIYDGIKRLFFGISGVKRLRKQNQTQIPKVFPKQNELEKLVELKDKGIIIEEEFNLKKKQKLDLEREGHRESEPPPHEPPPKSEKEQSSTTESRGHGESEPPPNELPLAAAVGVIIGCLVVAVVVVVKLGDVQPQASSSLNSSPTSPPVPQASSSSVETLSSNPPPQTSEVTAVDWYNKGHSFLSSGNYIEAIEAYSKAIALNPHLTAAYDDRAFSYYKLGKLQEAIKDLDKVIEARPRDAEAYHIRGNLNFELGNISDSVKDKKIAAELEPKPTQPQPQFQSSPQVTHQKEALIPASEYNKHGVEYFNKAEYDKAIDNFTIALSMGINPSYSTYMSRGRAYYETKKYDKAIEDFKHAISLSPNDAKPYEWCGIAFYGRELYFEATDYFSRAVELEPNSAIHYLNRGYARLKIGGQSEAVSDFKKACDLGDEDACKQLRVLGYR